MLQNMEEYLSSFRDGEKVYYLNQEGRERIDSQKVRKKTIQARHYLMRNEVYITYRQPASWKNEVKFGIKDVATVVADALFKQNDLYHAVEVDHMQKMSKNRTKVERYRKIYERAPFRLIWITTTEYRRRQLKKLCKGLDVEVFTATDLL